MFYVRRLFILKKNTDKEVKVTYIFNPNGADVVKILKESVLLFVKREVDIVCSPVPSR